MSIMGIGAQNGLWWGAPNFCPKNDFDKLIFALEINWSLHFSAEKK